jgi:hypothetical protein
MAIAWIFEPVIDIPTKVPAKKARGARSYEDGKQQLVCAACAHPITRAQDETRRKGLHVHCFANPGGFVYRIGCFAVAPGILQAGAATGEDTWFAGFSWKVGLCGACCEHLGWCFTAADGDAFFGLILDRLSLSE